MFLSLPGVAERIKGEVGCVSQKVVGMCFRAADSWHCASTGVESALALYMEIVCNKLYCLWRFCL